MCSIISRIYIYIYTPTELPGPLYIYIYIYIYREREREKEKERESGAKRTYVFQIIVTLFIFNIKKLCQHKKACNKCSFDYLH